MGVAYKTLDPPSKFLDALERKKNCLIAEKIGHDTQRRL